MSSDHDPSPPRAHLPVPVAQVRRRRLWPVLLIALVIGIGFGLFLPQRPAEQDGGEPEAQVAVPPPLTASREPSEPPSPARQTEERTPSSRAAPPAATPPAQPPIQPPAQPPAAASQESRPPASPPQTAPAPAKPPEAAHLPSPSAAQPRPSQAPTITTPAEPPKPPPPAVASPKPPAAAAPSDDRAEQQAAVAPTLRRPSADSDLPPWRRYAAAVPAIEGRAMVAVIIDDMGYDQKRSRIAMDLPGPLTLSFLPYARDLARQTAEARKLGHELMVHVAMQPLSAVIDPGPNALMVDLPAEENHRRLLWALDSFAGYVGINNHMGSRFTKDRAGLAVVMKELKSRGLLFLDSRTVPHSLGGDVAEEYGVPHAGRSLFIDNVLTEEEVSKELAEIEKIARHYRVAIAIGHPHDPTLAVLQRWLPTLAEKGMVLVPVSAIVARQEARRAAGQAKATTSPIIP